MTSKPTAAPSRCFAAQYAALEFQESIAWATAQGKIKKSFTEKAKQSTEAKGGVKSFEVVEEKISEDGLSATVSTKVVYGNGTESTEQSKYVKKDNVWKLSMGK